ncbi:MAG: hypothetical protein A2Z83_03270 [Omnitrophica bacterium GWA2_52_8]|nr:MAG: hypothetical protein A2Z83_03270 [Omnitrophica bacterium GWA2_52_8]
MIKLLLKIKNGARFQSHTGDLKVRHRSKNVWEMTGQWFHLRYHTNAALGCQRRDGSMGAYHLMPLFFGHSRMYFPPKAPACCRQGSASG